MWTIKHRNPHPESILAVRTSTAMRLEMYRIAVIYSQRGQRVFENYRVIHTITAITVCFLFLIRVLLLFARPNNWSSDRFDATTVSGKKIEKLAADKTKKLPCTDNLWVDNQVDRERYCRWPHSTSTNLKPKNQQSYGKSWKRNFAVQTYHLVNNGPVNHFKCYKWISMIRKCQRTIILVMTTIHFTCMHN